MARFRRVYNLARASSGILFYRGYPSNHGTIGSVAILREKISRKYRITFFIRRIHFQEIGV